LAQGSSLQANLSQSSLAIAMARATTIAGQSIAMARASSAGSLLGNRRMVDASSKANCNFNMEQLFKIKQQQVQLPCPTVTAPTATFAPNATARFRSQVSTTARKPQKSPLECYDEWKRQKQDVPEKRKTSSMSDAELANSSEPLLIQQWWESDDPKGGHNYDWKLRSSEEEIAWIKMTTFAQFKNWEKKYVEVGAKHGYSNKHIDGKIAERAREVKGFLNKIDKQMGLKAWRGDNDPRRPPEKKGHLDRDKFIALDTKLPAGGLFGRPMA